jgi:hypothetical protein
MPKLKRGPSDTAYFKKYNGESKYLKNKVAKLTKLAADQPNNEQVQKALKLALDGKIPYKRNRKSNGHKCKGLYKILGFINNQMNESMKKCNLGLHWFCGIDLKPTTTPYHSSTMCEQLEALGFVKMKNKYGKRKYKKTS